MTEITFDKLKAVAKHLKQKQISENIRKEKPHQCPYFKKSYQIFGAMQTHVFKKHPEECKQENDPKVEE